MNKYFEGIDSENLTDCKISCKICPFETKCKHKKERAKLEGEGEK